MTETEYAPGRGLPNDADTSETQALVFVRASVELGAPTVAFRGGLAVVTLRGRSRIPEVGEPTFRLHRGPSRASLRRSIALESRGSILTGTIRLRPARLASTIYLQVRGTVETLGLGASFCRPTFRSAGVPCVYATRTGLVARSRTVAITLPART